MDGAERVVRDHLPRVLGAVVRRCGDFPLAEDAVQEALLAALMAWPREGVPDNPAGWLFKAAMRRVTDALRAEAARVRREEAYAGPAAAVAPEPWRPIAADEDDSLALLFMCCHPSLTETSAIALTLRAVGGLSTREIAAAFLVPEATMGQRIARAKQTIRSSGIGFDPPVGSERAGRVAAVLRILYLIFNEGYAATSGPTLQRPELAVEAIRLARETHRLLPEDPEAVGLLALMLLTEARRSARETDGGELVPLDEQDRRQWDQELIREGLALIDRIVAHGTLGVYGMQAMIAAAHDRAPSTAETDWAEIEALYRLLARLDDNPMVHLNHAVALAMHRGPEVGLARLEELRDDTRLSGHFRYAAVRGHLCERAGCLPAALEAFREAHRRVAPGAERRFLERCLARVEASLEGSPADEGGPC